MNKWSVVLIGILASTAAYADRMQTPLRIGGATNVSQAIIFDQGFGSGNGNITQSSNGNMAIGTPSGGSLILGATAQGANGTVGSPAYSFSADNSSGIYRSASHTTSISTNGVDALDVGPTFIETFESLIVGSGVLEVQSGAVAAPSYAFTADTNSGIYRSASHTISVASNGVDEVDVGPTSIALNETTTLTGTGGNVPHTCTIRTNAANLNTNTQVCSTGEIVVGGGCNCLVGTDKTLTSSYPSDNKTWSCSFNSCSNNNPYAICCAY